VNVLVIDIGGSKVKMKITGDADRRTVPSGSEMTAAEMVAAVRTVSQGLHYDVVSIGYPGPVLDGRILREPRNLGDGWVEFDFQAAFGCPVKVINDAAMQALGGYRGGRMLFLGLGTGLGSAMVLPGAVQSMELAHLPYKNGMTFEDYVGNRGLERLGKKKWRKEVTAVVACLRAALVSDYVVLGGGNANLLKELPPDTFLGPNENAFVGGFRMWDESRREA
jgi:polyphosphate glucokinase